MDSQTPNLKLDIPDSTKLLSGLDETVIDQVRETLNNVLANGGWDVSVLLPKVNTPITIEREASGLVHIEAQTDLDTFLGLGFVHAFDRLWQMDYQRRIVAGRLAEIVGPDAVEQDILQRTLGLYEAAESAYDNLETETKAIVDAYTAGINAFLSLDWPLPFEFQVLDYEPEPWTPEDVLAAIKLRSFALSGNFQSELFRAELISEGFTLEQINTIFPPDSGEETILQPRDVSALNLVSTADEETSLNSSGLTNLDPSVLDDFSLLTQPLAQDNLQASNNWVVSGERTTTGKPFLANDPHLSMELPPIWYSVHLESPNFNVAGASIPGVPGIAIGYNEHIAWGATNSQVDVQDLYLLDSSQIQVDPEPEVIEVRGDEPILLTTRSSQLGPVISDALDLETPLALRWPGLEESDGTLEAFLGINQASNWDEFKSALESYVTPVQNFVYADIGEEGDVGNIGYIAPGQIPDRQTTHTGLTPVPASPQFDWKGFIPFDQLPQTFNPERGYIISANNRIAPDSYPYNLGFEWAVPYRAERIRDLINSQATLSLEDMQAIQLDQVSYLYRDFQPILQALKPILNNWEPAPQEAQHWLNQLLHWDGDVNPRSRQATVFETWYNELTRLPASLLGEEFLEGNLQEPAPRFLLNALTQEGYLDSLDEFLPSTSPAFYLNLAAQSFVEVVDRFEGQIPQWGEIHEATFTHPLLPLSRQVPFGGDRYTINVGTYDSETFEFDTNGATYRQIIDLSDPTNKSVFIQAPGQSGRIISPFFDNLLSLWQNEQYLPLTSDQDEGGQRLAIDPDGRMPVPFADRDAIGDQLMEGGLTQLADGETNTFEFEIDADNWLGLGVQEDFSNLERIIDDLSLGVNDDRFEQMVREENNPLGRWVDAFEDLSTSGDQVFNDLVASFASA